MLNPDPHGFLYRLTAVLAGLAMISLGAGPIFARHDLFYTNWFGELVFAPLAVVFGFLTIASALFKPEWLTVRRIERKRTHRRGPHG